MRNDIFFILALAGVAGCAASDSDPEREPSESLTEPLNVIVLLVDDWGWTDAGCCGSDLYETPNVDRLAASGVRFTDAYASCTVCSPTRAAVMTGMYPARLHLTDWITGHVRPRAKLRVPEWTQHLEHRHTTLAEALAGEGYRTAHIGKWHLTQRSESLEVVAPDYPDRHGFEVNVAGNQWGMPGSYHWPYVAKKREGLMQRVANFPEGGAEGDYLTDRLTDEALALIDDWRDEPFFLYFAYYNVHTPIEGKAETIERYRAKLAANGSEDRLHTNPTYASMVDAVDESVGRILDKLEELEIDDRTLIVLTGDNGGLDRKGNPTENAPLRAGKGSAYEGGVRVPGVVRWPGVTRPGTVCREPIQSIDFYPTILSATGGPRSEAAVDGADLAPLFRDPGATLQRALFWHYPHYHPGGASPYGAVREGDWRLVEFYEDDRVELYNLAEDIGEARDLAGQEVERTRDMRQQLHTWRASVEAQMPTANPAYQPSEGGD